MSVLCIGDSLTYGRVGYSYIPYLKTSERIINKGVNGDTTSHAFKRLLRIVKEPKYSEADTYIVGIGTNDILLPYMTTISSLWNFQMKPVCRQMNCIMDHKIFAAAYERYVTLLKKCNKKVILIGLPYIQLENYPHNWIKHRNGIIKRLATIYDCPFVDIYTIQCKMAANPRMFSWKYRYILRLADSVNMTLFPRSKEWYERSRRLELSVDGVHFSKKSATALANEINRYL